MRSVEKKQKKRFAKKDVSETMSSRILLKNCRFIVTQNDAREILEEKDILLENGVIAAIGKKIVLLQKKLSPKEIVVIDCKNSIVLPGLINAHTHIGMQQLRGICDDEELHEWLMRVVAAEHKLTEKDIFEGSLQACKEMLASGTTSFCEMYYPIKPVLHAVHLSGMRALLCQTIFAEHGNPASQQEETVSLIKKNKEESLIQFGFGPHALYSVDEKRLQSIKLVAQKYAARTCMHVAETRTERVSCFKKNKSLPVQYLDQIGFLDEKSVLVHAVWLTKGEIATLAQRHAMVVHCPTSNMKLAGGGVMALKELLAAGVTVGLGTDSVASNNSLDMFSEMKTCALLQKHHYWDPTMASAQTILDMATRNGAAILGREDIGQIAVGMQADFAILKISNSLLPLTRKNILSAVVYAARGSDVSHTIIRGKLCYCEGIFFIL